MIVAGLTGSIAMGKSTVAAMFAALGAPVFDADVAVRMFYAGKGKETVEAAFPGVLANGGVDRDRLAQLVLADPAALKRLESLVHPAVAAEEAGFIDRAAVDGRRLAIVDVPLLFETGGESRVRSRRGRQRPGKRPAHASVATRRNERRQARRNALAANVRCGKAAESPFRYRHWG